MQTNQRDKGPVSPASLTRVFLDLKSRGYRQKFRREPGCLSCMDLYQWFFPDDFTVDESYYFGDSSWPDTDRMMYAITTRDGIRGILVDACGVYADTVSP